MNKYLVVIYGKNGCEKCVRLKREVSHILEEDNSFNDFDMDYQNLSTIEGMQTYALSETVNGQRIPALQIMKYSEEKESYVKIPYPGNGRDSDARPFRYYLQLETDYSSDDAAINPEKIKELMSMAQSSSMIS
ncbi:MAG: hypothetical protein JXL81_08145 [Deltaproteobacteria bacterium]|nr:hypothetical protein [Deltaproteobacteria bacterium]